MASLHAWRMGDLPRDRQKWYEDTVDLLLDRWENRQKVWDGEQDTVAQPSLAEWLNTDRDKVRELLNRLAYEAHANQPEDAAARTADIAEDDLVNGLLKLSDNPDAKPGQLVIYLRDRAGLLLARGKGVFTFPHRTFQEYMAACYLTGHPEYPDFLAELARQRPNRWREVLLLAGAKTANNQANSVWDLADALLPEPLSVGGLKSALQTEVWGAQLAGQMLAETVKPDDPLSQRNQRRKERVQQGLQLCLQTAQLPAAERAVAGQSLAVLGDPRPAVMQVDRMRFCLVPPGPFRMGDDRYDDAKPHLNEYLDYPYWLGQAPVTNAQFIAFAEAGGYAQERYWHEAKKAGRWRDCEMRDWDGVVRQQPRNYGQPFNLLNQPVVGIIWYEALAFCRWLTEAWQDRLPAGYSVALPSEAEWEKGARGGVQILAEPLILLPGDWQTAVVVQDNPMPQRRFPWGETVDLALANTKESTINAPSTPGCFPSGRSPCGCQDMSGNVWEWTRSLWGAEYPYVPQDGREDLTAGDNTGRVLRGGSYYNDASACGCGRRRRLAPSSWSDFYGFRVCVSPFVSDL